LGESHKLDPWPLDEGPRPKSGKSRLNLHDTNFGRKINWFETPKEKELKRERAHHHLKKQDASEGPMEGPTQGFNLLHMSPNLHPGPSKGCLSTEMYAGSPKFSTLFFEFSPNLAHSSCG
jgi:hypothetical protein